MLAASTSHASASEIEGGSVEYQRDLAELLLMVDGSARETDIYQLDFMPLEFDRIVIENRLGEADVFHYLTFRLRNVSDTVRPVIVSAVPLRIASLMTVDTDEGQRNVRNLAAGEEEDDCVARR